MNWINFVSGVIAGTCVGMVGSALCQMAKNLRNQNRENDFDSAGRRRKISQTGWF